MSNTTDRRRKTGSSLEDYAILTYEAHTYAMSKPECRELFSALDDAMMKLGFNRMSGSFTPNQSNTKVFEYVARYQAEIDRDGQIYRRR